MAKSKKKKEADDQNDVTSNQKNFEEGAVTDPTAAHDEEQNAEEQSLPVNKQSDKPADEDRKIHKEDEVREAAEVSAAVPMKQRLKDVGDQAMRDAKRKSQAPPSSKVKRKEPSKAPARAAQSRKPMKKKATGVKAKAKTKTKSKSR